jgi:hypothetical protein
MPMLTRSDTRATVDSIMRAATPTGRKRLAKRFASEVFRAIAMGRCSDAKYTIHEVLKLWRRVGLVR